MGFYDVVTFGGELKLLNESGIVIPYSDVDVPDYFENIPEIDMETVYSRDIKTPARD